MENKDDDDDDDDEDSINRICLHRP
jgi:hypothetical protein